MNANDYGQGYFIGASIGIAAVALIGGFILAFILRLISRIILKLTIPFARAYWLSVIIIVIATVATMAIKSLLATYDLWITIVVDTIVTTVIWAAIIGYGVKRQDNIPIGFKKGLLLTFVYFAIAAVVVCVYLGIVLLLQ